MKPIVKLLLTIIPIGLLTGCVMNHEADYVADYKDYLKYSLGDYSVISAEEKTYIGDPVPVRDDYIEWKVQYKTDQGSERIFSFNNRSSLYDQVLREASSIGIETIKQDFINQYFSKEVWDRETHDAQSALTSIRLEYEIDSSSDANGDGKKALNDKHGLKLRSVTPQELVSDWNMRFRFLLFTDIDDKKGCEDARTRFENMIRKASEHLGQDEIQYEFNCDFSAITFKGRYSSATDTFTGKTKEDMIRERDYTPDGLLKKYRNFYYNGERTGITGNGACVYSEDERQYYINPYAIRDFFRMVGTESPEKPVKITWNTGSDHYELNYIEDYTYTITKNDEVIYTFRETEKGLTIPEFEVISGTKVTFDSENKSVNITSVNE